MWFEDLIGFKEENPRQVRSNIILEGNKITSKVNGKTYTCGELTIPTLEELRKSTENLVLPKGRLTVKEWIGDAKYIHTIKENAGALFQVASQFNLLEMRCPSYTPEHGIGIYEYDTTQGPACAIAAGAGTIYRNYFATVNNQIGQTTDNQIDAIQDLGIALGNTNHQLWKMKNGYVLTNRTALIKIQEQLSHMNEDELDALSSKLRIGIQWNTEVTVDNCGHLVTQTYNSALPVTYNSVETEIWKDFARLVLDASYEATFHAALLNYSKTDNNRVFLTLLGGGAFGNNVDWISTAIQRSLQKFKEKPLEVHIVSYKCPNPCVQKILSFF